MNMAQYSSRALLACGFLIGFSAGCEISVVAPAPSQGDAPAAPPAETPAADVGSVDEPPLGRPGYGGSVVPAEGDDGAASDHGAASGPDPADDGAARSLDKADGAAASGLGKADGATANDHGDRCTGPFPGEEPSDGSGYYLKPGIVYAPESPGVYLGKLALGDIDGDRRFDFVTSDRRTLYLQTHPRVRELDGQPLFTPSPAANTIEDVLLLDADLDGALDVVVAQAEGLAFLHNQGGGVFAPPRAIASMPTFSLSSVRFNDDAFPDIVGIGYGSKIFVYLGDGQGGFELAHDLQTDVFPSGVVAGDVTGDGLPDAVVATSGVAAGIAVFPYDGARGFDTTGSRISFATTPPSSGVSFVSVAVGDLNNDGRQDVAAITHEHTNAMKVWILLQDELGNLTSPQPLLVIDEHQYFNSGGLRIADLNLDGRNDLVAVSRNTAEMWLFLQTPEGTFESRPAPFPGTFEDIDGFGLGITDFDCNGCPDVVGVQLDGLVVFRGRGCATER